MISAHWSFIRDTVVPKPGAGEVVMTKAWVERGLSLPCSVFLSILTTYGLQPHNICPNSYLLLSNFVTLCEGHLSPDVKLWQFFFRVKKETKDKAMLNCGSMTFMLRPGRMYPPHDSHESVPSGTPDGFTRRMCQFRRSMMVSPSSTTSPEELASWSFPPLSLTPIPGESDAENLWFSLQRRKTRTFFASPSMATRRRRFGGKRKRSKHLARRIFLPGYDLLRSENLRSSYQELEIKLKEAEQQKEQAEKQLAEKNSELIREKANSC
ncbi:hypothetical protein QYE76_043815 [Lolium multiflorum]|uniref:Transposase (putative) gypsy type domain-containing protein n=1 Tax=Lolium multiflorum TaxID=4521 RepID=A0AAD8WVV9_LOLMU|nr:hypothetical protein QYE76_043815 [Lolium multiflorum]